MNVRPMQSKCASVPIGSSFSSSSRVLPGRARCGLLLVLISLVLGPGLIIGVPGRAMAREPGFGAGGDLHSAVAVADDANGPRTDPKPDRELRWPRNPLRPRLALGNARPEGGRGEPSALPEMREQRTAADSEASQNEPRTLSSSGWLGMDNTVNAAYFGCSASDLCIEPPDPAVAVGPYDVVQTVNTNVRVYDRSGTIRRTTQLQTLFGTEFDSFTADPQIVYHEVSGRWFMTVLSADCYSGYLHLAVSNTGDPTGTWSTYTYEYPGSLPDYPGLGISNDKIVVGVNEYAIDSYYCSIEDYIGTSVVVADIPDLLDDTSHWYVRTSPDDYFWNLRPALNESSAADAHAIVTDYYGYYFHLLITGSVVDYVYAGVHPLTIYSTDLYYEFAPEEWLVPPVQPGGELDIDGRVTSAVWSAGRLAFVSTYPCLYDPIYNCVRVSELNTLTETRRQDFIMGDSASAYDSFMGGITITDAGTLYAVWTRSRSNSAASIFASYQPITNALNDVQPYTLLRSGAGSYVGDRWGDYVILATDPNSNDAVWQADEFASSTGGWATFVSRLSVSSVGTPKMPDGRIRKGSGTFIGNNIYNTTGAGQTKTGSGARGNTITFGIQAQNDASSDSFRFIATGTATTQYTVKYFRGTTDITAAVVAGTYTTPTLAPGAKFLVTAKVTVNSIASVGSSVSRLVTITSIGDNTRKDTVKFIGKRS